MNMQNGINGLLFIILPTMVYLRQGIMHWTRQQGLILRFWIAMTGWKRMLILFFLRKRCVQVRTLYISGFIRSL